MWLVDLILNLVALLLAFGWRAVGLDQRARPAALSLASTVKRAERAPTRSWAPLAVLALLLLGRAILYHETESATRWSPSLDFGPLSLHFRLDLWSQSLLFTVFSFLHVLVVAHLWMLLLLLAGARQGPHDSNLAMVRAHLGPIGRLPAAALLLFIPISGFVLWFAIQRPCVWMGLLSAPPPTIPAWRQASAFGLGFYLAWTFPAMAMVLIHLLNTYLYVGESGWWLTLARCGRNLARWLPLAFGKLDLAPIVVAGLIFGAGWAAERGLAWLFSGS